MREWTNRSFFKTKKPIWNILKKKEKKILDLFLSKSIICSFIMSDLNELLTVTHLSWATWASRSWSLICLERPERFAHRRSCVLSDLSESLKVAHLIWAKWANEQIPSPEYIWTSQRGQIYLDTSMYFWTSQHGQIFLDFSTWTNIAGHLNVDKYFWTYQRGQICTMHVFRPPPPPRKRCRFSSRST